MHKQIQIERMIRDFGSESACARAIGVSQPTVNGWRHLRHGISPRIAIRIQKISGGAIAAADLCPALSEHRSILPEATTVAVEDNPSDDSTAVITLPTNRYAAEGETYTVTDADLAEYTATYPAVDVAQALRSMLGWLRANPRKRKTQRGMPRFINTWLSREQNRGGTHGPNAQRSAAPARRLTAAEQIRESLSDCD